MVNVTFDVKVQIRARMAAELAVKIQRMLIARVGGAPQIRVGIDVRVAWTPEHFSDLAAAVRSIRVVAMPMRPLTYCSCRSCKEEANETAHSGTPHRLVRVVLRSSVNVGGRLSTGDSRPCQ